MKPKWLSLKTNQEKMEALEKWIMTDKPSIGFKRLVGKGLAEKTLEAVIVSYPECSRFFKSENVREHCIDKFRLFLKGKEFVKSKDLV